MNSEIIFLIENSIEGGYEAKALGHSIYTEADTIDELKNMIRDALICHFNEHERPKIIRLHFVKEEVIAA
ncbi:MAG: 2-oxoisovalerate dehydrogenase [Desulfobacterales bacterium]|nr:2-oxoisovalerate dehydrogenase [Desulfobacterales bacterium]